MSTLFQRLTKSVEWLTPNRVFVLGLVYVVVLGAASFFAPDAMSPTLLFTSGSVLVGWQAGKRRSAMVSLVALLIIGIHDWFHPPTSPFPTWLAIWNGAARFIVVVGSGWLAAEASRLTRNLHRLVEERTAQWKAEAEQHKATSVRLAETLERLEQLSDHTRRQAWILESMGEAMITTTQDGIIELTNPAAERLTGYGAGELVGKPITLLSPFAEAKKAEKFRSLQKRLEGKTQWSGEIPIRRKDGRTLITRVNLSLLKSVDRTVMIALYDDVTEQLRAESQLRAREERIQLGLEAGRMITWDLDIASGGISYSESLKSFLGGQDVEPYRNVVSYMQQIHPEDLEKAVRALESALKDATPTEHEYRVRHPDGTYHWYLTKGRALHDSAGHPIRVVGASLDITERKRAELQLADALELNRTMIAACPVSMVAFKANGQCVFANPALAQLTHGTVEQLMAQNFWQLPSWRDSGMWELAKEALNQGQSRTAEMTMTTSFGRTFCAETSMTRFERGGEAHLLVMTHDITERKRAEESLALSQRQLAAAMELARLANWEYDVATDLYTFDDRFFALYGTSAEREGGNQMTPETYAREFFFPEDAQMVREGIKTVLAATDPNFQVQFEHRIRRRDGEMRHVVVRIGIVRNASGQIVKFRGVNQDITERKRAELQLADALQLNRTMIAAAPVGIAAYKASGQCIFVNEAISRITGGSVEQMLQENFREFPSWRRNGILNWAEEGLRQGYYTSSEMHGTTTFGRDLWCQFFFARFVSGGEDHLLLIVHDVSSRKRLEQQILEITDREQARIGQDLHDGLCQQLVSLAFDANALQRRLSAHNSPEAVAAARIADFLDQAITESRRVSRGLFPIRLQAEGLASALEELARTTAERFGVQCSFQNSQTVLAMDLPIATHLFRIAQEAVSNAIKHGRPRAITIRLEGNAPNFDLHIEDDGTGLSPNALEQAGMGLHIMRYRATSIGATIRVEPRQSGGVTVSCCFRSPSS